MDPSKSVEEESHILFYNGTVILPDQMLKDGIVYCRDGKIAALGRRKETTIPEDTRQVDAKGGYICPGYIDIHTHGGGGTDFMDGTSEAVKTAIGSHTKRGTTTIFPTTTTGSIDQLEKMIQSCNHVKQEWTDARDGARIGGVHFYGPYFAEEKVGCTRKDIAVCRIRTNIYDSLI